RLEREASIWVQLNHSNLVPFIGVCYDYDISKWPCLVSPLYECHVGTYLRDNPSADRKTIILGVASGLEYLHAKEVIHADLKVSNVFVDQQGVAHIGDFGLSKILDLPGFTTRSVGTVPYMAPELFFILDSGRQINPTTSKASDIYSFGLLALEILTSERPKERPRQQFVTMKMFSDLRPKRTDYLSVPDEIWSVLNQCWESDPDARPSASALRLQFASALKIVGF
ncbi:kinase-like domain-containing protein, partial [Mycena metata]